jgi:hypothetical protein
LAAIKGDIGAVGTFAAPVVISPQGRCGSKEDARSSSLRGRISPFSCGPFT